MSQKSRMTALDVRAAVVQLRQLLVGLRLANIYDVNFSRRIYLFKFAKGDEKHHVLVESGIRIHTTLWKRNKNAIPSSFAMKLRKHLRSRRLEGLYQLGADRVIDFVFGTGPNTTHLIIELYVSGNIVLTDSTYTILSVLRKFIIVISPTPLLVSGPHSNADAGRVAVGRLYPIPSPEASFCLSHQLLISAKAILLASNAVSPTSLDEQFRDQPSLLSDIETCIKHRLELLKAREAAKKAKELENQKFKKKREKKSAKESGTTESLKATTITFREAVASVLPFAHPSLQTHGLSVVMSGNTEDTFNIHNKVVELDGEHKLEHLKIICAAGIECIKCVSGPEDYLGLLTGEPLLFSSLRSKEAWATIEEVVHFPRDTSQSIDNKTDVQTVIAEDSCLPKQEVVAFGEFTPLLFMSHKAMVPDKLKRFDDFLQCLDTFFTNYELLRQTKHEEQTSEQGLSKSAKIKIDQERRVEQLMEDQQKALQYASLIEANLDLVQQSIAMLQAAVSTGVAWSELWNHIKLEKRNNHPIACRIHSLDLQNQRAYLLLELTEDNAVTEDHEVTTVPVDLDVSAYGNIKRLHSGRKHMKQKVERTETAAKAALEKTEKKDKKKGQEKLVQPLSGISRIRKHYWFEKFNWFISSENYLVLAGRDAQQNDLLFKRYFEKNDIYVHADIHGAASCIIKNPTNSPIPPITLLEAGRMSVCRSTAWDNKLVTSAWWVYRSQVSKTAPTGEYLVSGGFIIRGKKNFLPPWRLEMGFGVLFHLGEDSVLAHLGERCKRGKTERYDQANDSCEDNVGTVQDLYGSIFPSEASRQIVEAELAQQDIRYEEEAAVKQLRRLEKKQKQEVKELEETGEGNRSEIGYKERTKTSEKQEKRDVPTSSTKQPLRGKRSKLKKLKQKYKEQEPDEREVRFAILGAKNMEGVDMPIPEIQPKNMIFDDGENENSRSSSDEEEKEKKITVIEIEHGKEETEANDIVNEYDPENNKNIDEVSEPQIKEDNVSEEKKEIEEDDEIENTEIMIKKLNELDSLTAVPKKDDTLIAAVPVCAPWSTLQSYKYKIKLVPGNMKKGKAGQQCIKILSHQATSPSERDLIRMIDLNDLGNALVANIKISMPGLQDLQKAEKNAAKQQKAAMRRQQDE